MRSDVNKVLTECYKEGSGRHYQFPRKTVNKLFDETGGKIGMRQVHVKTPKHGTKSFGENLAYLPRFLAANVGRKWDDIYSEISATFDRRSTVNAHIFQHLFDYFVPAHEVVFVKNRPYRVTDYRTFPIYASSYKGLYVDPRSGILKEGMKPKHGTEGYQAAKAREKRERIHAQKRVLSPLVEMHKLEDGFWYVFTLKLRPKEPTITYVFNKPFPIGYDSQDQWFKEKKRFDGLSKADKAIEGRRVEEVIFVKSVADKVPYGMKSSLVDKPYNRDTRSYGVATHYYASMRSASKKELRAVGL